MQAARLYRPYDLRIEEIADPGHPDPGWARLRIAAVGICGSDLHYYREGGVGTADVEEPLIMGHEFSAFIDDLGSGVEGLEVSQLVAVEPGRTCGQCESCQNGHPNLCPHIIFCGYPGIDGALQEYLLYPAEFLYPLPEGFTPADGAMLEPLGIGLHALRLGKVRPGGDGRCPGAPALLDSPSSTCCAHPELRKSTPRTRSPTVGPQRSVTALRPPSTLGLMMWRKLSWTRLMVGGWMWPSRPPAHPIRRIRRLPWSGQGGGSYWWAFHPRTSLSCVTPSPGARG